MSVIENMAEVKRLESEVKRHCLCLKFEVVENKYRVIYPEGYFPQGSQVSISMGKAKALSRLLEVMERHWKESFFC